MRASAGTRPASRSPVFHFMMPSNVRRHRSRVQSFVLYRRNLGLLNLYEPGFARSTRGDTTGLRSAPVIDIADLVHAGDGAVGSAALLGEELLFHALGGVVGDGHRGIAALLAAVVHEAVFTNVQITRARPAAPVVGLAVGDGFLKVIEARVAAAREAADFVPDLALALAKRLQLAAAVVDDADSRAEAEFECALGDGQCVLGMRDAAADDGVDVHVKVSVFGEHAKLSVQNLQGLLRNLVRHHVVDRDLHVIEAGLVKAVNAIWHQQIAVRDHSGDGACLAHRANDVVELGVQQRLAAGDGDYGSAETAELADSPAHLVDVDGLGEVV